MSRTPDALQTADQANIGRASVVMATGTALSRVLGLVRNVLMVAAIGATGFAANAFDVANKLPNVLNAVISAGIFNVVLVPAVMRAYQSRNPQATINKLITLAVVMLTIVTAILTAAAAFFITIMGGAGWSPEQRELATIFAIWCIPQLFFYGLYMVVGQVLNAHSIFAPYAWAPVVNNIISIVGWLAYLQIYGRYHMGVTDDPGAWDGGRIALFAGTATFGIVMQAMILFIPLHRAGIGWKPMFGLRGLGLRTSGTVVMWTIGGTIMNQLGVVAITRIAASAEGAVEAGEVVAGNAAYSQALAVYIFPHSLITVSIATALFTGLSAAARRGDRARMMRDLDRGMRTLAVFTVFAAVAFVTMSIPIVHSLVPTLDATGIRIVANVLIPMAVGLIPLGAMVLLQWAFFALENGRAVFYIQTVVNVVLVGVAVLGWWLLPPQSWVIGIAVGMTVSHVVAMIGRARGLRKDLGRFDVPGIIQVHIRCLTAAVIAAIPTWLLLRTYGDMTQLSWPETLIATALLGLVMLVIYIILLKVFKVSELNTLLDAVPVGRLRRH